MPSSITKSLPSPCILVNLRRIFELLRATGQRHRRAHEASGSTALNVETKMHDVAVADDVVLAFEPHFSSLFCALLALAGEKVIIGDDFGPDKAFFEIGVDHAGSLGRGAAAMYRPGTDLLRPGGEVGLEAEQLVAGVDQAVEPGFGESHVGEENLLVGVVEIGDLGFECRTDRDDRRSLAGGVGLDPVEQRIAGESMLGYVG